MSVPGEAAKLFSFSFLTSHKQQFQGVSRLCYRGPSVICTIRFFMGCRERCTRRMQRDNVPEGCVCLQLLINKGTLHHSQLYSYLTVLSKWFLITQHFDSFYFNHFMCTTIKTTNHLIFYFIIISYTDISSKYHIILSSQFIVHISL